MWAETIEVEKAEKTLKDFRDLVDSWQDEYICWLNYYNNEKEEKGVTYE